MSKIQKARSVVLVVTLCLILVFAFAFFAMPKASFAASTVQHPLVKYITSMQKDGVLPKVDAAAYDLDVSPADYFAGLGKVLDKEIPLPKLSKFTRTIMLKWAVDNSVHSKELSNFTFKPFCLANDEETISERDAPYFNMAYRPKYQLLTYRKGRNISPESSPSYAEAAYMLYMLKHPPNADPGQSITMVTANEPDTMNIFTSNSMSAVLINTFLYQSDISFGSEATLYPIMLTRVPSIDNGDIKLFKDPVTGVDKMKVIYRIRHGMFYPPLPGEAENSKLHEITADDYLFSFRVSTCPLIQSIVRSGNLKVDYLRKIDKYTVEVGFNELYTYANFGLGDMYKAYFELDFYTKTSDFNVRQDFADYGIGPYKVKLWERGDHIEYMPNPYALFAQPLVPKIVIRFMQDPNTIKLNMQSGNVDIVSQTFSPLETGELEKKLADVKFYYTPATTWDHVQLNQFKDGTGKFDLFGDKRVRQALLYSLDREMISKIGSNSKYKISDCWLIPTSPYYDEKYIKKYEYNPSKAEKLLDEAGWKLTNVNGEIIRCKDGDPKKPFKFKLSGAIEFEFRRKAIEQMVSMWGRVGIKIEPGLMPSKVLLGGDTLRRHLFDAVGMALVSNPVRPSATMWRSDQVPSEANGWSGQCYGGWVGNKENDELCTKIESILPDLELREAIGKQMALWTEELPALPMFNRVDVDTAKSDIQNIKPTGANRTVNWNAEFWYREPKK